MDTLIFRLHQKGTPKPIKTSKEYQRGIKHIFQSLVEKYYSKKYPNIKLWTGLKNG